LERLKRESRIRKRARICIRWGAIEGAREGLVMVMHGSISQRESNPPCFFAAFSQFLPQPSLPFPKKMLGVCVYIALHGINWI